MSEIEKMMQNTNVKKHWNSTPYGGIEEYYPPFTAEKVLKVVLFFLNKSVKLSFSVEEHAKITAENFKECIAFMVSKYWQDLTEEEKQQIKEILNG